MRFLAAVFLLTGLLSSGPAKSMPVGVAKQAAGKTKKATETFVLWIKGKLPLPGVTVGKDLGTTNSVVGYGQEALFKNSYGNPITPSRVGYSAGGEVVGIGEGAVTADTAKILFSVKRIIGKEYAEVVEELEKFGGSIEQLPIEVVEKDHMAVIKIGETKNGKDITVTPEQVSAEVLKDLKRTAESYLGGEGVVDGVVITVPARFDVFQKGMTQKAARIAVYDREKIRLIPEPVAASVAYGADKEAGQILVYDFGGGTFDVSVVDVSFDTNGVKKYTVKATHGSNHLGGDDIDEAITEELFVRFKDDNNIEALDSGQEREIKRVLRDAAEEVKINLSEAEEHTVHRRLILDKYDFETTMNRDEFNEKINEIIDETIEHTREAINDAGVATGDINNVVLVGGSTRNSLVREKLAKMFGEEQLSKSLSEGAIDPDKAVARGASILAKDITEKSDSFSVADIVNVSIGVDTKEGFAVILNRGRSVDAPVVYDNLVTADEGTSSLPIVVRQGEGSERGTNKFVGQLELPFGETVPKGTQISVKMGLDESGNVVASAWKGAKADERLAKPEAVTMDVEHRLDNPDDLHRKKTDNAKAGDSDANAQPEAKKTDNAKAGDSNPSHNPKENADREEKATVGQNEPNGELNDELIANNTEHIVASLKYLDETNGVIPNRDIPAIREAFKELMNNTQAGEDEASVEGLLTKVKKMLSSGELDNLLSKREIRSIQKSIDKVLNNLQEASE